MMADVFGTSQLAVLVGITTFCLGFALAPMALAPFSEINGRYPVFVVSGSIYVLFQAVCGLVPNLAGMLIARFLVGVGGSVFSTMVGGVIADLWHAQGRNTPMAVFSGFVLVGTGAGPLVSALIVHRLGIEGRYGGWRWVFWHQAIAGGILMVALVTLFKETRGSVLLSRKAKTLNKWYEERERAGYFGVWVVEEEDTGDDDESDLDAPPQVEEDEEKRIDAPARAGDSSQVRLQRIRWIVKEDEERSSIAVMISISIWRPFHLLFTEPVVFFFSLWVAFAWAVLYLTFGSIPYVFNRIYGWNIEKCGYMFSAMMVGSFLSTVIGVWQDDLLRNPLWRAENWDEAGPLTRTERFWSFMRRRFPVEVPESRLYFTCITATLLPVGLFIFGFTSDSGTPWIVPAIAICLATMGIFSVYLATFNYLADVYHVYASSALAAQSFCRNILGGVFPLVTVMMFKNLGNDRAGGLLGGIAMGLTLVPWVLVFYGERIRRRSKFAMVLEKT
ncbi:putative drug transporter protein [Phaeoacremonium minimum UCRPA7]|uniref:Putative drug transporter protein n=1 Tax=Phaeoacremonium minimum (strain UCR-PA7) TaxID=1286976 RepID=R8BSQ7_PHAM7|nr:putative drug transporter protein [Phaeoacremonium minimum UCRPA7]EOO02366.1 putative drug transporter protein [Phaeoacremonium minimum UCRPA7]